MLNRRPPKFRVNAQTSPVWNYSWTRPVFADPFQTVRNTSRSEPLALTGESHRVWLQRRGAQTQAGASGPFPGLGGCWCKASRAARAGWVGSAGVQHAAGQAGSQPSQPLPGLLSSSDGSVPLQVRWLPVASGGACWKGSSRTAGTNGALGRTARRTTSPSAVPTVSIYLLTSSET